MQPRGQNDVIAVGDSEGPDSPPTQGSREPQGKPAGNQRGKEDRIDFPPLSQAEHGPERSGQEADGPQVSPPPGSPEHAGSKPHVRTICEGLMQLGGHALHPAQVGQGPPRRGKAMRDEEQA